MFTVRGATHRRFISQQALTLRDTVRKLDYDNFLCGLLLPSASRDAFYAIRAFNIEIARIKDSSRTNPGAGKIRIQWWRQRLHDLFDSRKPAPTDHVVLAELHSAIHRHQLTQRWLDRILEARELDLEVENPSTVRDLDIYAEKTAASMLHLALECLDVRDDTADIAARHAGIAVGITTLLRGTTFHASQKCVYLPQDILTKHQVAIEDVLAAACGDSIDDAAYSRIAPVTFDVACHALDQMRQAQAMQSQLPRAAIPAFYTTISSQRFLARLEKYRFNLMHPEMHDARPHGLQWALFKHSLFRSF
ncbi:hypothetical protein H310_00436 [Aphanomyces invadans]|uniref:15-cis-phytoene synthase n=1 Tax=Aphanomyces invadans TaxID=157072 RepID=A0A024UVU3_9STRA|nr:hypothetical protein H310_00436 [Aphanomyces invadans]ETW10047.1 hypothetical protein H310_00436 [Aphanomyces invadans]|eukprot:XP_008861458.1 hypothetical protein H310_00436 [Aphanomyces invadans]